MAARSVEFLPSLEEKPRSVTQLSVIFSLAVSKKYTVSGVTFSFK